MKYYTILVVKRINTFNSKIIGTGSFLPEFIVTNNMLEKIMDTSDEWISSRTGIKERHVEQNLNTYEILSEAGEKAIKNAVINRDDIDMIIVSTCSEDYHFPSAACLVQNKLGIKNAVSFDISAACAGFIFALDIADMYIKTGRVKNVLVLSGDILTRISDYSDRSTAILFGDGAGGAVVQAAEKDENVGASCIVNSYIKCDCENENPFYMQAKSRDTTPIFDPSTKKFLGNSSSVTLNGMIMNGREVFKFAVNALPKALDAALEPTEFTIDDLSYIICHQANKKILDSIIRRYNIPEEKLPVIIDKIGNTSSSTVPILLDELNRNGKLKRGDLIGLVGFGSGLTYGANIIRW